MADITSTLATTSGFVPDVWAARALDVLRANIILANLVSMDKDFTPAWKGKTLNIGYPGTFSAVDKTANTPLTPQTPNGGTTIQITLDHHKAVPFLIEDFAAALANGTLYERYIEPAAVALAEQVETDLFGQYANFAVANQIGQVNTNVTYGAIVQAQQVLNTAKAPVANRFFVLSTKDQAAVQTDATLQHYFDYRQNDAITDGRVGRLAGFDFYYSQLAPSVPNAGWLLTLTGSTGTVSWNGNTSAALPNTDTAALVQTALVPVFGAGNVLVTGATGGPFTVVLTGTLIANILPVTVASTATIANLAVPPVRNLAMHKSAIALAVRPFEAPPAGAGVMTTVMNDPDSGLSLRLSAQYDINNVGVRMNLDILYGLSTIRPTLGVAVQS